MCVTTEKQIAALCDGDNPEREVLTRGMVEKLNENKEACRDGNQD